MLLNLSNISTLQKFVNVASSFEDDIVAISGKYTVNAKSIMGLLSLDLSYPVRVEILSNDKNVTSQFSDKIGIFGD